MLIQFNRKSEKDLLLIITRTDGSQTWTKIHPGLILHDLAHYTVEKELQIKNGFFGIINEGIEIEDFESHERRSKFPKLKNLPLEAIQVEHVVNLLQIEYLQNTDKEQFLENLKEVLESNDLPYMTSMSADKLKNIREEFYPLSDSLTQLKSGETLELELNIT